MKKNYGAIMLAGGQSSRMGQDKASLEIEGQTMLERLLVTLRPLVAETVVIRAIRQPSQSNTGRRFPVARSCVAGSRTGRR